MSVEALHSFSYQYVINECNEVQRRMLIAIATFHLFSNRRVPRRAFSMKSNIIISEQNSKHISQIIHFHESFMVIIIYLFRKIIIRLYNLIFFMFIRFPAILLVETIESFKNWSLIFFVESLNLCRNDRIDLSGNAESPQVCWFLFVLVTVKFSS